MSNVIRFKPRDETTEEIISDSDDEYRITLVDSIALSFYGIAAVVGENDMVEAVIDAVTESLTGRHVATDPRLAAKIETLAGKFH